MPGYVTNFARKKQLDHRTGVTPYSPPPFFWLALTTVVVSHNAQTIPAGVELTGAGYVAQQMANDGSMWTPALEDPDDDTFVISSNLLSVVFPTALADYVAAFGWALKDDPSPAGNVWEAGPWEGTPIQPRAGEIPTVAAGQILRRSFITL